MRNVQLSDILLPMAVAVMLQILSGCGSHRRTTVSAGTSSKGGDSYGSVVRRMPQASFNALPEASQRLLTDADGGLGVPYAFGGTDRKKGVDCSGLTTQVFLDAFRIKLPRNSAEQQKWCQPLKYDDLTIGDLVFFSPKGKKGNVGHVGIYVGDGRMIHSSSSKGVIVSNLSDDYYTRTYHSAGRVASYYAMLGDGKSGSASGVLLAGSPEAKPEASGNVAVDPTGVSTASVSVDRLGQFLAGSRSASTDTATRIVKTVHLDKSAAQTGTNPSDARSRALKKLNLDD